MPDLTIQTRETFTSGITSESLAFDKTQTITGVNSIQKMLFEPAVTGQTELIKFAASASGPGILRAGDFKYLRITNFDSSNAIEVYFSDTSSDHYYSIQLNSGCSYILTSLGFDANDTTLASGTSAASINKIQANSLTAACNVELIIGLA